MSVVVAKRYAKSIFTLAKERGALEKTYEESKFLITLFKQDKQAFSLLINPVISFSKKREIFKKAFSQKISSFTLLYFYFIIKNKRADSLTPILEEYNILYRLEKKITCADVITAKKSTEELRQAIKEKLGLEKNILFNEKIDEKILGGVLIRVGDQQFDSTVKNSINKIKSSFKV